MTDWGWVVFAYVVVYGTLFAYALSLVHRTRRARREVEGS